MRSFAAVLFLLFIFRFLARRAKERKIDTTVKYHAAAGEAAFEGAKCKSSQMRYRKVAVDSEACCTAIAIGYHA
jgi:hypothetical protein